MKLLSRARLLPSFVFVRAFFALVAFTFVSSFDLAAQTSAAVGAISGRVQNAINGNFINNARVSIKGTNLVTLTDDAGYYRLANVPVGEVTLRVFFTGLDEQEISLAVTPGETVTKDVRLTNTARFGKDDAVMLDPFTVQSTRETNATAIAVNEQRVALGQKSVVSADQFGTIPDSNPGELMKWLPGVSVEYFANNIVGVSVRGLDAVNTEIRFDGMPQASASTATLGTSTRDRNFEMLGSFSADVARVEVRKLRTPEDSANAIGGSINLIRRSAFEFSQSRFTYNALFSSDFETFSIGSRDGPRDTRISGWRPNLQLTWTDPVSKTLGYAITVVHNDNLSQVHWSFPTVNFGTADQAAAAAARVAAGKPLTTPSVYNPQFRQEGLHDNPKQDITDGASVKIDWRPTSELKVSYTLTGGRYQERAGDDVRVNWNTGTPSTAVTDAVLSAPLGSPGTNDQHSVYGVLGAGTYVYDLREAWRNGVKTMFATNLISEWRHGDWTVAGGASYSTSKHVFRDTKDGFFGSTTLNGSTLPNTGLGTGTASPLRITLNLSDRDFTNAHTIKAYQFNPGDTTLGAPIDWQDLHNSTIGGAVSRPGKTMESIAAVRLSAKRSFDLGANPFNVRLGFDYQEQYRNVQSYDANLWTFVGADHKAGTADDNAAQIAAVNILPRRDAYYNFPAVPRISMRQLYNLYVAHPDWFAYRDAESYRFSVGEPYEILEKKVAPWLEFSGSLLANRLTYVGGVRYEKSTASGLFALDRGSRYVANLGLVDGTFAGNVARYVRKGGKGHGSNDGYYPSFEANYNIRDNLIFRIGYAATKADNRFTRSIIPSSTSTLDLNPVTTGPFAGIAIGTVNRSNPNLKPWTADNYEAHLEYYTAQGGVMSVGGFLKEIQNVQIQQTILLDTPAKLNELDLESSFLNFQSSTWVNMGKGEISGVEAEIRQPLDTWLPGFARGLSFTGSASASHLAKFVYLSSTAFGNVGTDFQNFYEKQFKGSIGYHRGRLGVNLGAIYNGRVFRQREDVAASATAPAIIGYRYYPPYTTVDFNLEFAVTRWAKLFISGRNITNARKVRYRVLDGAPEWSNFQIANSLGASYTAGVTGSF